MEYICEMADKNCYSKCYHNKPHPPITGCFDENARCFVKGCYPICITIGEYEKRNEFLSKEDFDI